MTDKKKVIRYYYGFQVFFNLLLWVPVFYEVQKQIGLSDPDIFHIQSLYYLAFIFFEIPTGFLADKVGYKKILVTGSFTLLIANLIPVFFQSFSGFLWHFTFIALSRSLISGAASAYLYEYLQERGEEAIYKEIEGNARSLGLIAKIISWSAVGYLMKINVMLPYSLTAVSSSIGLVFAYLLPTDVPLAVKQVNKSQRSLDIIRTFKGVFHSRILLLIILQGVGIFVLARISQINLFQPILKFKGFDIETFGWIMAMMTVFEAFAASRIKWLRGRISDMNAIYVTTSVIALSLFIISFSNKIGVLIGFSTFSFMSGFALPIQKQLVNDYLGDLPRATILSIESIFDRTFSSLFVLPMGSMIANGQLIVVLIGSSIIAFTGVTLVHLSLRKKISQEGEASC